MQYGMKLDAPANEDQRVERDGAFVVVDPESLGYLDGCVIDFSDTLNDSGFKIQNPNAVRNCGCGTSFETANSPAADPNASCE
jgi:iron-sulfur cluster assembly protein